MLEKTSRVRVHSNELSAEIDPNGAQLFTLKDAAGRDLLWNGVPEVWAGRAPILFPIVGMLVEGKYRVGNQFYPLSRHGFARNKLFAVQSSSPASATFRLSADESTLAVYPFRFELDIQFEISGATLTLMAQIRNKGPDPMPASFGWHPGFLWPLPYGQPRAEHFIEFETGEPEGITRLNAAGLLKPERFATPVVGGGLALTDALFNEDAMIFDRLRSRSVVYGSSSGPQLKLDFPTAPILGIWTKPGAPFICIEPWHGISDPDGYAGDFRHKPGVFEVAPGTSTSIKYAITIMS